MLLQVDYDDVSITENTRASYPIEAIDNAAIPCVGPHPKNLILLCCDAFGVLPPVSRLSHAQAMYHFISGYTAKVAGTEQGVTEPCATFSACFGGAFLAWHPMKYAAMLAEKMRAHGADAWLVNTGWTGGGHGVGRRMSLPHTRAIVDAIHSGALAAAQYTRMPVFGLEVPQSVPGVPSAVLQPRDTWGSGAEYDETLAKLAGLFEENMAQFTESSYVEASLVREIVAAGPTTTTAFQERSGAAAGGSSSGMVSETASREGSRRGSSAGHIACAIAASTSFGRLDQVVGKRGLA